MMPFHLKYPTVTMSEQDFREMDYEAMEQAFHAQNKPGRRYNLKIYQHALPANGTGLKVCIGSPSMEEQSIS